MTLQKHRHFPLDLIRPDPEAGTAPCSAVLLQNVPLMSSLVEPNDEKTGGNFTKNQIICHVDSDESRWWLHSRCAAAAAAAPLSP